MSKYAVSDGDNGISGSKMIRVVDEGEARAFIEANADMGTYMDYFDAVEAKVILDARQASTLEDV